MTNGILKAMVGGQNFGYFGPFSTTLVHFGPLKAKCAILGHFGSVGHFG